MGVIYILPLHWFVQDERRSASNCNTFSWQGCFWTGDPLSALIVLPRQPVRCNITCMATLGWPNSPKANTVLYVYASTTQMSISIKTCPFMHEHCFPHWGRSVCAKTKKHSSVSLYSPWSQPHRYSEESSSVLGVSDTKYYICGCSSSLCDHTPAGNAEAHVALGSQLASLRFGGCPSKGVTKN